MNYNLGQLCQFLTSQEDAEGGAINWDSFLMPAGMVPETQRLNIYDTYHTGNVAAAARFGHGARGHGARHGDARQLVHYYLAGTVDIDIVRRVGIVMSAFKPPQYGRDIIHKSIECCHVTLIKQGPTYGTAQGSYHILASSTSTSLALLALLSHLSSRHGIVRLLWRSIIYNSDCRGFRLWSLSINQTHTRDVDKFAGDRRAS